MSSYNLLDEPWIQVVDAQGRPREASLRTVLIEAHCFTQLGASLPHTNAAIYRLLLAVLQRVFRIGDEEDWHAIWSAGRFDPKPLEAYFDTHAARFDLFSPGRPFYQQRHPKVAVKPANALLFLIAGSDADTLFDHSIDTYPVTLLPAQAAQMLVTAQSFGLAGLCHPQLGLVYTDAPCSRGAVFFLSGKTLFETLALNLTQHNKFEPIAWRANDDLPAWEMDDPYHSNRTTPDGYLDYLTWHNRRIYLIPSEQDGQTVVREVTMAPGLALSAEVRNPMHHYTANKKDGFSVLRFREGRALWRDSTALLNLKSELSINPQPLSWAQRLIAYGYLPDQYLTLTAYGMSTEPGKQKVYFYRGEQFRFPEALLQDENLLAILMQAQHVTEDVRGQLWGSQRTLASLLLSPDMDKENSRKADPKDMDNLMAHWEAESQYWSTLERPFYMFLDQLPGNPGAAFQAWQQQVRQAALNAFDGTARGCGDNSKAMKASAKARLQLLAGLKKVLSLPSQEENG